MKQSEAGLLNMIRELKAFDKENKSLILSKILIDPKSFYNFSQKAF